MPKRSIRLAALHFLAAAAVASPVAFAAERSIEPARNVHEVVRSIVSVPAEDLSAEIDRLSPETAIDAPANDASWSRALETLLAPHDGSEDLRARKALLLLAAHPELLSAYRDELRLNDSQSERLDRLVAGLNDAPTVSGTLGRVSRAIKLGKDGWRERLDSLFDGKYGLPPATVGELRVESQVRRLRRTDAGRQQLALANQLLALHSGAVANAVMSQVARDIYNGQASRVSEPSWHRYLGHYWKKPLLPGFADGTWFRLRAHLAWKALEARYFERTEAWLSAQWRRMHPTLWRQDPARGASAIDDVLLHGERARSPRAVD